MRIVSVKVFKNSVTTAKKCKKIFTVFAETVHLSNSNSEVILQKMENIAKRL
jgi:hypothetical protein